MTYAARRHLLFAILPIGDLDSMSTPHGSELEEPRPTASPGIGKLIDLVSSTDCPRFVPGNFKIWLRGRDLNPRPLGYEPLGTVIQSNVFGLCQPTLPAEDQNPND